MSKLVPNKFTAYELTEQEQLQALHLPTLTLQFLYTLRTEYCMQKISLKLDPALPQHYVQEESYLAGQINILDFLIESAELAQQTVAQDVSQDS